MVKGWPMVRIAAFSALVAIVAALAVTWFLGNSKAEQFAQCSASSVAGAEIGGPFELVNQRGKTVTDAQVLSDPSLVYFGYTYCPDVCPLDVSRNAEAIDLMRENGVIATPVFISIDPQRDTTDVIGNYAEAMHDDMIALTGTEAQVAAASKAYKTYYKAHKDGTEEYLVDHSTMTYLMLPEHGFVEFFRRDATAEQIAERTTCFIQNS